MCVSISLNRIQGLTLLALLACGLAGGADAAGQTTLYVDDDATADPGPGDPGISDSAEDGSAEHPFDAIQEALDAAVDGDTVLVKNGTYAGIGNRDLDFAGKLVRLSSEDGPDDCTIDCGAAGRGLEFTHAETGECVVDGFLIVNGNAYHSTTEIAFGCGIYISDASPTIINCHISHCRWDPSGGSYGGAGSAGGGIYCANSDSRIMNCTIVDNGSSSGGGVGTVGGHPQIVDCVITGNTADAGAGVSIHGGQPTLSGCIIAGNTLALFGSGGGLSCFGGQPLICDCIIRDNGGEPAFAGGIYCSGDLTVCNCRITGNWVREGNGGGIYSTGSALLSICTLANNGADNGGGIYHRGGTLTIAGCVFARNSANVFEFPSRGGSIWFSGDTLTISACTIVDSRADEGGGGVHVNNGCAAAITNSIVWGNGPSQLAGDLKATCCDVQGAWSGAGNLADDPLFVDASGDDYHLSPSSPCINAGTNYDPNLPETDIDDDPRIRNCRADMGADESPDAPALTDCNGNSVDDDCDIWEGTSSDSDQDHVPDECDTPGFSPLYCGTKACGAGIIGWMPLTLLALGLAKSHRGRAHICRLPGDGLVFRHY